MNIKISDVLKCAFSNWYPIFQELTIQSDIIILEPGIKEWLLEDGIILPKACSLEMDSNFPEDDEEEDDKGGEEDSREPPEFPNVEQSIRQSIQKFQYVFPKLNWSACDDAKWIQASGTKCNTLSEVFLLLKSSDKIVHDLTEPFKFCIDFEEGTAPHVDYELVLRKWENINPSMEFRCFIARNYILGISQRDVRSYYSHLHQDKEPIIEDIFNFFETKVCNKLPDLEFYVIDVYRPTVGQVTLLDLNPFCELTDSLLFDWDELRSKLNAPIPARFRDFRYVEQQMGVQVQRYEMNALPVDVFNGNLEPAFFNSNLANGTNGHW